MALIVEPPVCRGKAQDKLTNIERRVQACRLRTSGWSVAGLAALYRVTIPTIELWLIQDTHAPVYGRRRNGRRSNEELVEELVALIQLDCWDGAWPQRRAAAKGGRHARKLGEAPKPDGEA